MVGLFMNFSRLTDKALREYDAARAELLLDVSPHDGLRTGPYLRARLAREQITMTNLLTSEAFDPAP